MIDEKIATASGLTWAKKTASNRCLWGMYTDGGRKFKTCERLTCCRLSGPPFLLTVAEAPTVRPMTGIGPAICLIFKLQPIICGRFVRRCPLVPLCGDLFFWIKQNHATYVDAAGLFSIFSPTLIHLVVIHQTTFGRIELRKPGKGGVVIQQKQTVKASNLIVLLAICF